MVHSSRQRLPRSSQNPTNRRRTRVQVSTTRTSALRNRLFNRTPVRRSRDRNPFPAAFPGGLNFQFPSGMDSDVKSESTSMIMSFLKMQFHHTYNLVDRTLVKAYMLRLNVLENLEASMTSRVLQVQRDFNDFKGLAISGPAFASNKQYNIYTYQTVKRSDLNPVNLLNFLMRIGFQESLLNDYEMLLALDESNSQHGAAARQINSLPESVVQTDNLEETCAICLEAPAIGEKIRHLPCLHKFHKECIDPWLSRKTSCPICKCGILDQIFDEVKAKGSQILQSEHLRRLSGASRQPLSIDFSVHVSGLLVAVYSDAFDLL
ncbi:hypothetical protein OIU77_022567 [Salix suchowensis]|uniref:RING-type domain-containing protein n=1 Tax=Salix suchowensis TaxID=1278906 RepID=A0ABQ9C0S1_9ROSI|nr:hypothetical protein OIU77_022567 [Salix suchowensis]